MRSKKVFSFDEEKDAELMYKEGFPNGIIDYAKMYLIAKYIRQIFNFGEIRLERELIRFCQEQDKNFNPIKEAPTIRKWINSAMNYNLRKIESIPISLKEIEFLKTITNAKDRKILYCSLLLSKALKRGNIRRKKKKFRSSDNHYIHYSNFSDIIRLSRINNISEMDLANIFHNYQEYLTFYNPERELIRLNFIDKNPENEMIIHNPADMMDYYGVLFEHHRPVAHCIRCGDEIKKNSNKQKYCKKCAKQVRLDKQRELMRKRRAVST